MSTHNIPLSISERKSPEIIPKTIMSAAVGFLGTQERVRNSRGIRDISVRAIEILLYKGQANVLVQRGALWKSSALGRDCL